MSSRVAAASSPTTSWSNRPSSYQAIEFRGWSFDGLHVELTRARDPPPRLLGGRPGLERLDRERIERVRALRAATAFSTEPLLDLGVSVVDPPLRNPRSRDRVQPGPGDEDERERPDRMPDTRRLPPGRQAGTPVTKKSGPQSATNSQS